MKLLVGHILLHFLLITDACTEIRITSEDSTVVVGRSMEYAADLAARVIREPKGHRHTANPPPKCTKSKYKPMQWTNVKSLFLVDVLKMEIAGDGQNAAGLSIGSLLFPGFAKYQDVPMNKCGSAISHLDFPLWILGNFRRVQEIRDAINGDTFPLVFESSPVYFELHYSVQDKTGDAIIIEFNDQGRKIYNNTLGAFTNSPSYDWHMLNLRNYVQLSNNNHGPLILGEEKLEKFGQGSGLIGMPGDLTPPSRLVRAAMMTHFAEAVKTSVEAVNLAVHIMNTVDIPIGVIYEPDGSDYTQWIVIKDLKNNVMYFRGYEDVTLYSLRLDDNFSARQHITIARPMGGAVDITNEFESYVGHDEL